MMELINCDGCGIRIISYGPDDRLCYNCEQKNAKAAKGGKENKSGLKVADCEYCGSPIVVFPKDDPFCYNCEQKRFQAANEKSKELMQNAKKAVKATGRSGGLDQWL